jgi:hypothetical protein
MSRPFGLDDQVNPLRIPRDKLVRINARRAALIERLKRVSPDDPGLRLQTAFANRLRNPPSRKESHEDHARPRGAGVRQGGH